MTLTSEEGRAALQALIDQRTTTKISRDLDLER